MYGKAINFLVLFVLCSACATSKNRKQKLQDPDQQATLEDSSIFDNPRYLTGPEDYQVPAPKLRHEHEAANHAWSGYGEEEYVHRSLSAELITEVIDSNGHDIQACYQKIFPNLEKPRSTDTITLQMTILGSGETEDIKLLTSSFENWLNPPMEKCLSSKILSWRFQKSQNPQIVIQQKFLLSP